MVKKFTRLIFVNDNLYLKDKRGFSKVKGIQINTLELDFFLYKNNINFWCIVDGISGVRITKFHKTVTLAKNELSKQLGFQTKAQIENKIFNFLKKNRLSPRYRYIAKPVRKYVASR